jgi:hypothetical protein
MRVRTPNDYRGQVLFRCDYAALYLDERRIQYCSEIRNRFVVRRIVRGCLLGRLGLGTSGLAGIVEKATTDSVLLCRLDTLSLVFCGIEVEQPRQLPVEAELARRGFSDQSPKLLRTVREKHAVRILSGRGVRDANYDFGQEPSVDGLDKRLCCRAIGRILAVAESYDGGARRKIHLP